VGVASGHHQIADRPRAVADGDLLPGEAAFGAFDDAGACVQVAHVVAGRCEQQGVLAGKAVGVPRGQRSVQRSPLGGE